MGKQSPKELIESLFTVDIDKKSLSELTEMREQLNPETNKEMKDYLTYTAWEHFRSISQAGLFYMSQHEIDLMDAKVLLNAKIALLLEEEDKKKKMNLIVEKYGSDFAKKFSEATQIFNARDEAAPPKGPQPPAQKPAAP